jgi:adenosylcobinamide kinase / adenosylcobinamide-phosphate guanylyltransferase
LSAALAQIDDASTLIVVDCLTLWLTNWLMPAQGAPHPDHWAVERAALLELLPRLASPVVFVSNEVGWGISPLGREVRHFVDELGRLNQDVARRCARLTLMVAGQAWTRPVEENSDA